MANYTYSVANDTLNSAVLPGLLQDEVAASLATVLSVSVTLDVITIEFPSSLSGGDEATLTAIVNAHTAVPPAVEEQLEETQTTSGTPSTTADTSVGYRLGDILTDPVTQIAYVLVDDTAGAAVWKPITIRAHGDLTGLGLNQHPQYQLRTEKGVGGGYASLDGTGKIPVAQLPATAIPSVFVVADEAARLALTVQEGDEAIQTDNNTQWIWDGSTWIQRPSPNAGDVVGPALATDNALVRYDGTTGRLIQDGLATLDDSGNLSLPGTVDGRDVSADGTTLDNHVGSTANPHQTSVANLVPGSLAQLNSKVTDATLDDAGSPRTPTQHNGTHTQGGSDPLNAQDLGSGSANAGEIIVADGAGGWNLQELPDTESGAGAYFDAYNTAEVTAANNNWNDLALNTERKKTADFTHLANSNLVTINADGTYVIIARVTTDSVGSNARSQSEIRVLRNGTLIDGSLARMYNRQNSQGEGTGTVHLILDLVAGDTISVQWRRSSGGGTLKNLANYSGLSIFTTSGPQGETGPQGPPGAGGMAAVQEDGVEISASPTALNFGTGLLATESAGTVTIDAQAVTPVFGSEFAYNENVNQITTSSQNFADHAILNVNVPAGQYYVQWYYEWDVNVGTPNTTDSMRIVTEIDGQEVGQNEWSEAGLYVETSGFVVQSLASGSHTIRVRYRSSSGVSVSIRTSRLAFWRVA